MNDITELINRWKHGDESAAQTLYEFHHGRCFRLAYSLLTNVQDAEEVAQDALTYALVNIEKYRPKRAQFSTWLHTIVVSRVRDKQRRKRLNIISLTSWMQRGGDFPSNALTPEQVSELHYQQDVVFIAVNNLTPQLKEAIVLRYWAGHSFREMAKIMGCPIGTAQSRVRRGFEKLRTQLTSDQLLELSGESI